METMIEGCSRSRDGPLVLLPFMPLYAVTQMVESAMCATDPVVDSSNMETKTDIFTDDTDGGASNEDILISSGATNSMGDASSALGESEDILDMVDKYFEETSKAAAARIVTDRDEAVTDKDLDTGDTADDCIVILDSQPTIEDSQNYLDLDIDDSQTGNEDLVSDMKCDDVDTAIDNVEESSEDISSDVCIVDDVETKVGEPLDSQDSLVGENDDENILGDSPCVTVPEDFSTICSKQDEELDTMKGMVHDLFENHDDDDDVICTEDSPSMKNKQTTQLDLDMKGLSEVTEVSDIDEGSSIHRQEKVTSGDDEMVCTVTQGPASAQGMRTCVTEKAVSETKQCVLGEDEDSVIPTLRETIPTLRETSDEDDEVICTDITVGDRCQKKEADIPKDVISEIDNEIMKALNLQLGICPKPQKGKLKQGRLAGLSIGKSSSSSNLYDLDQSLSAQTLERKGQPASIAKRRRSLGSKAGSPCSDLAASSQEDKFQKAKSEERKHGATWQKDKVQKSERSKESEERKQSVNRDKPDDEVVWICFICARSFADQTELMTHQDMCEEGIESASSSAAAGNQRADPSTLDRKPGTSSAAAETGSQRVDPSTHDRKPDTSIPVPTLLRKVGSEYKTLPLGLPCRTTLSPRRRKRFKDIYIPPPRDVYFECLGLVPTPTVAEMRTPRKSVCDEDCQIIDLTIEESPLSHSVLKSPRTQLISQLSREGNNGRRRHLSFSQTSPRVLEKIEKPSSPVDSDSVDSSDDDAVIPSRHTPSKAALFGIPLTSLLGQRVKQHWAHENKVPIISNMEQYCKTDTSNMFENLFLYEKSSAMIEKLRHRPPPKVTFKYTKKYLNKWFHSYKFEKRDKREFEKTFHTGLNRESRIKRKQMKPCKLVIRRLNKKDIKYWTTPRPKRVESRVLSHPQVQNRYSRQMLQLNINPRIPSPGIVNPHTGYRLQYHCRQSTPRYSNFPTQGNRFQNILFPQQITRPGSPFMGSRGPTPQLLVRTVAGERGGLKLEVVPVQGPASSSGMSPIQHNQKRKQTFDGVRADDNMVICLSSDEEDEAQSNKMRKKSTEMCSILKKKKIGPASFMRNLEMRRNSQSGTGTDSNSPKVNGTSSQDSASSRVFGKTFQWNTCTMPQLQMSSAATAAEQTHISIQNGQIVQQTKEPTICTVPSPSVEQTQEPIPTLPSPSVQESPIATVPSPSMEQTTDAACADDSESKSDSEYMDYEVICLDSDSDD